MEITIPELNGCVGLRILHPERGPHGEPEYFTVELAGRSMRATARVDADRAEGLVGLFEAMARDWKGWKGTLDWTSLEGDFGSGLYVGRARPRPDRGLALGRGAAGW